MKFNRIHYSLHYLHSEMTRKDKTHHIQLHYAQQLAYFMNNLNELLLRFGMILENRHLQNEKHSSSAWQDFHYILSHTGSNIGKHTVSAMKHCQSMISCVSSFRCAEAITDGMGSLTEGIHSTLESSTSKIRQSSLHWCPESEIKTSHCHNMMLCLCTYSCCFPGVPGISESGLDFISKKCAI